MKLTVAIPTIAGRESYLASCLRTCTTQNADFEILVSDNPGGAAREVTLGIGDPRVRYVTPPNYLPMSAHWDFVLTQAHGKVITFIGDDDGLMPDCIKRVEDILSQTGEIPIHHALANYWWPDAAEKERRGKVAFFHAVGSGARVVGSTEFLSLVARAKARYVDGPMIYHNFIPTELLRRISLGGVCFRRASPDVYSALAIAANVDTFVSTEELLTISGQGAKANGAAVRSGQAPEFVSEAQQRFPSRFAGNSIQMQLVDSLIEVAEAFNRPELLRDLDLGAHLAGALLETRGMPTGELRLVLATARESGAVMAVSANIAKRMINRIARRRPSHRTSHAVDQGTVLQITARDIYQATHQLKEMFFSFAPVVT